MVLEGTSDSQHVVSEPLWFAAGIKATLSFGILSLLEIHKGEIFSKNKARRLSFRFVGIETDTRAVFEVFNIVMIYGDECQV